MHEFYTFSTPLYVWYEVDYVMKHTNKQAPIKKD